jgi:hypothetical protein
VKVLLVSFYFPPAGGGGVQRPLKLAQYLPALGIETHVLAPDDPRWMHRDEDARVPTQAWVHRLPGLARAGTLGRDAVNSPGVVVWNAGATERRKRRVRRHVKRPSPEYPEAHSADPWGIAYVEAYPA